MKKVPLILLLLVVSTTFSCKKWDTDEGPTDIRIRNLTTEYTFQSIEVNTSQETNTYSTLGPGADSDYKRFDIAYRQAQIDIMISDSLLSFTPVNFTYEVYLGKGKFTYEVWVVDLGEGLLGLDMRVGNDTFPLDD